MLGNSTLVEMNCEISMDKHGMKPFTSALSIYIYSTNIN